MNDQQVVVRVRVTMLSAHYKDPLEVAFHYGSTPPQEPRRPEFDPNYVSISFAFLEDKYLGSNHSGGITLKTEDAKKLALMVGDVLTLKLVKDIEH